MGQTCTTTDILEINKNLSKTLSDLQILANKYAMLKRVCDNQIELNNQKENLDFNGVGVEDLCLVFTLPGFDEFELIEGGLDIDVNLDNLQEYIDAVTDFYLVESIAQHVEQFRIGLNMVSLKQFLKISSNFNLVPGP